MVDLYSFSEMPVMNVKFFLLAAVLHFAVALKPYISYVTPDQYKDEGESVKLQCTIGNSEDYPVAWEKINRRSNEENIVISLEDLLVLNDPRLDIKLDEYDKSTYTLTITDLRESDSGLYRCQVIVSSTNTVYQDVNLQVRRGRYARPVAQYSGAYKPLPTISYITPRQSKYEDDTVDLACTVANDQEGYPVIWTKKYSMGYIPIASENHLYIENPRYRAYYNPRNYTYGLRITNLEEEDAGIYRCELMTSFTDKVTRQVELEVEDIGVPLLKALISVSPRITRVSPSQYKQPGEEVLLSCTVENVEKQPVIWTKDDNAIASNEALLTHDNRYSASHDPRSNTYYLRIINLAPTDAGSYMCSIFDPEDDTAESEKVQLQVGGGGSYQHPGRRPEITYITQRQYRYEGDEVLLSCTVANKGDHPVLWMKNDKTAISSDDQLMTFDSRYSIDEDESTSTYELRIKHLRLDDSGAYTCEVMLSPLSPAEKISKRVDLQVSRSSQLPPGQEGRPYIANISPSQVKNAGDSVVLECTAKNVEDFPVVWVKDVQILGEIVNIPLTTEDELLVEDDRYSVREDPISSTYYLKIDRLHPDDSGEYSCVIMTGLTDKITKDVRLDVRMTGREHIRPQFSGRRPRISYVSPSEVRRVGDSVTLQCRVDDVGEYSVLWIKDDNDPITADDNLLVKDRRYSVTQSRGTYNLRIQSLHEQDTGVYACVVMLSLTDYESRDVRLDVRNSGAPHPQPHPALPPLPPSNKPNIRYITPSQSKNEREEAILTCTVDNLRDQTVSWTSDSKGLLTEEERVIHSDPKITIQKDARSGTYYLTIRDLSKYDGGRYTCEVKDRRGYVLIRKSTDIDVRENWPSRTPGGRPYISQISRRQAAEEGGTAVLSCTAENVADYPVLWSKVVDILGDKITIPLSMEDELLVSDRRYSVTERPISAVSSSYELRIDRVDEGDAGKYECSVLLSLTEKIEQETELDVRRTSNRIRPTVSRLPSIVDITPDQFVDERTNVALRCTVQDVADYPVIWVKDDEYAISIDDTLIQHDRRLSVSKSGSTYYLNIRDAKEKDTGVYTCVVFASNFDVISKDVRVQVGLDIRPGKAPFSPRQLVSEHDVEAPLYSTAYLNCTVEGQPIPSITWYKDSRPISESSKYHIEAIPLTVEDMKSTLQIKSVDSSDYGTYTCKATNRLGNQIAYVNLFGYANQKPAPLCNIDEAFISKLSTKIADQITIKVLENLEQLDDEYDKLETIVNELQREYTNIEREIKRYYRR